MEHNSHRYKYVVIKESLVLYMDMYNTITRCCVN